jgi:hypothetical protein
VGKYGGIIQATDDIVTWCKLFACWINKASNTHSAYKILPAAQGNCGYVNLPHNYVIPVLPLFSDVK